MSPSMTHRGPPRANIVPRRQDVGYPHNWCNNIALAHKGINLSRHRALDIAKTWRKFDATICAVPDCHRTSRLRAHFFVKSSELWNCGKNFELQPCYPEAHVVGSWACIVTVSPMLFR